MQIHNFDATKGQAFQGDVSIMPIPDGIKINTADQIKPIDGRLILQEGEATGHHHAITLPRERNFKKSGHAGLAAIDTNSPALKKHFGGGKAAKAGTAKLYRDPTVAAAMVTRKLLTRADLAVACLVVEGGPVEIRHEEHDGIRVPEGRYLIGRQVESAGAEERVVLD